MIDPLKKYRINWIDGMKISKEHFMDIQDYAREVGKDVASIFLDDDNYGILPINSSPNTKFIITPNTHNSISVTIQKLSAITANGARVEINETTSDVEYNIPIEQRLKDKLKGGYVVLIVDFNQDEAFGKPNQSEIPPRLPYINNKFSFAIVDNNEIKALKKSAYWLPIAKINKEHEFFEVMEHYIPPAVKVLSDERLIDFYNYVITFLHRIEKDSIKIVKKIRGERNKNPIADVVWEMSAQMLTFLGREIVSLESKKYHNTPRNTVNIIMKMARILKNHIDTYSPNVKESVFLYFGEWVDMKGGDFEKLFTKTININYVHYDLALAVKGAFAFMEVIGKLFDILTEIDYIGKKKDTGLFVNENKVEQSRGDVPPSFLAD